MKKPKKRKQLPWQVKRKKIGGMQRGKSLSDNRLVDDKKAAIKLAEETKALAERRIADIQAGKFEPHRYGEGKLKRGPKVDESRSHRDKCSKIASCALTPNEWEALEKWRLAYDFPPTPSKFLRLALMGELPPLSLQKQAELSKILL